jgi:putative acetyltransferase
MAYSDAAMLQIHLEEISSATSEETVAHARELLLEYGRFVLAQQGVGRFCFGSLEKEAAGLPASYREQGGGCLIAFAYDAPAGFVAWRALPTAGTPGACELKRLWVRPASRGLELGRTLTLAVLDRARAAGCEAVYLDTDPVSMAAAHRIYVKLGFEPCAAYNNEPVEGLAYLRKDLQRGLVP